MSKLSKAQRAAENLGPGGAYEYPAAVALISIAKSLKKIANLNGTPR